MNRRNAIKTTLSAAAAAMAVAVDSRRTEAQTSRSVSSQTPSEASPGPPLEGKQSQHSYRSKKYNPGASFEYTVYLSKYYTPGTPAALLVQFDAFNAQQTAAMEKLAAEGLAPPFVVIAGPAGRLEPSIPGGTARGLRVENYDDVGPEFPNFLVEELIPEAIRVGHLSLSANPDLHMTSGGSSGGYCAFNACWYRNDYFRRAYLASPSFFALAGADEFITYANKWEPSSTRLRAWLAIGRSRSSTLLICSAPVRTWPSSAGSGIDRYRSASRSVRRSPSTRRCATAKSYTSSSWKTPSSRRARSAPTERGPLRPTLTGRSSRCS
jgi:enterochelin esterase-like enzyme